jgi:hypothetical protein
LKFATQAKRNRLAALLRRYRAAVRFFIAKLWQGGDPTYHELAHSLLSARFRSAALRQAQNIVHATRKTAEATGQAASRPDFHGAAILDAKFATLEEGRSRFDLAIRLSGLVSGERLTILTKATCVLRKWLAVPGARLVQGCGLSDDGLILWVELPELPPREEGDILAVDIGVHKLLSDSEGNHYGTDFKALRDKIRRKKPGSAARRRAYRERTNFINRVVNQLPWGRLRVLGHERLTNLKRGKHKDRSKQFRKAIAPWLYRQVIAKIDRKAEENRVRPLEYDPRDTSRRCPECGTVRKDNRRGELFRCQSCDHAEDADTVGARNGLVKTRDTLASLESARRKKSMTETTIH